MVVGEEIEITVTLKILGSNDAGPFTVTLTDGDNGPQLGSEAVDSLPSGETARLVFTWRPGKADIGDHSLIAVHDFADDNSANDSKSTTIKVISDDAPAALHVADLDGVGSDSGFWLVWLATVDIQIQDNLSAPVSEAEVDLAWSDGSQASCVTDSSGVCQIVGFQWFWIGSISVSVVDVYHPDLEYYPAANQDPDGDSDGTRITINRP